MQRLFLAVTGLFMALGSAHAQDSGLPLWEAGVFGGVVSTPAYPGAAERSNRALVLPVFIYRGEIFRADRGGVGARMVHTDQYELDIGFSASLPASSNDVAARRGMPDLGTLIEFGPRLKVTLAQPTPHSRLQLALPLRAVLEINSGTRGQGSAFEPEVQWQTRDAFLGWNLSASGGLVFGDSQLNQYLYGIPTPYATATRPAYDAQAGLIASRWGLSVSRRLLPDVQMSAFVRYENYANAANRASPLWIESSGTSAGVWITWILGRSEARASN